MSTWFLDDPFMGFFILWLPKGKSQDYLVI
jgi:hypothetical protein